MSEELRVVMPSRPTKRSGRFQVFPADTGAGLQPDPGLSSIMEVLTVV